MTRPFVSVLIDTYNHERFLEEAIVSVLEQDFPSREMEIVVVDDGSTDRTPEIVGKFAPRVRYLKKCNGGQASAFNAGIPETRGEIVAFLDGDDWWEKDKLSCVCQAFEARSGIAAVGHAIWDEHSESGRAVAIAPEREYTLRLTKTADARLFPQLKGFFGTSRVTIRRAVLERVLPIPQELVVEADEFMSTVAVAIGGGMVLRRPLTHYRLHANNLFQFTSGDREKVLRKYRVMDCLARQLPQRLALGGLPSSSIEAVMESIRVDADRMRLILEGGKPWQTFSVERASFALDYAKVSPAYRVFKAAVLALTLVLPPRRFYQLRGWYSNTKLRKMRGLLGEPTSPAPIIQVGIESGNRA